MLNNTLPHYIPELNIITETDKTETMRTLFLSSLHKPVVVVHTFNPRQRRQIPGMFQDTRAIQAGSIFFLKKSKTKQNTQKSYHRLHIVYVNNAQFRRNNNSKQFDNLQNFKTFLDPLKEVQDNKTTIE